MAYEGLKRFLSLVPERSVAEAQAEANMTDEEVEQLVLLCAEILDSEKSASVYDLGIMKRLDGLEQTMRAEFARIDRTVTELLSAFHGLLTMFRDAGESLEGPEAHVEVGGTSGPLDPNVIDGTLPLRTPRCRHVIQMPHRPDAG